MKNTNSKWPSEVKAVLPPGIRPDMIVNVDVVDETRQDEANGKESKQSNKKGSPRPSQSGFHANKCGDLWLLNNGNKRVITPHGMAIGSTQREIVQQAAKECEAIGDNPDDHVWTNFGVLCSYFDFGLEGNREGLIDAIMSEVNADPYSCQIGGVEKWAALMGGSAKAEDILREYLHGLTRKSLMALVYSCAHFNAPLVMSAYLAGKLSAKRVRGIFSGRTMLLPFPPGEYEPSLAMLKKFAAGKDDREMVVAAAK